MPSSESTAATPPAREPTPPDTAFGVAESWTSFAAWAGDLLGLRVTAEGSGYCVGPDPYQTPEEDLTDSGVRRSWLRRKRKPTGEPDSSVTVGSPRAALDTLLGKLRGQDTFPFARPAEQPEAVHDLTDRLFAAYELEGGKAHVAGFHLADRPFVRLSSVAEQASGLPVVRHAYFDAAGAPVEEKLVRELGLDRVAAGAEPWPRPNKEQLTAAVESARGACEGKAEEPLATIVWAKHASGRLRFEFGDKSVDATFDGWAQTLQPPPVVCPETGRETRRLATTSDGRIAAAEEIAASAVTGRWFLRGEMDACSATGGLIEEEYLSRCDATDQPVRKDKTVNCPRCGQRVAPAALKPGACVGCENARRVAADDPRLASLLDKHPRLRERRWSLAETPHSYVLIASGVLRRRCVTIEKETLEIVREAVAPRFSQAWRVVS